MSSPKKYPRFSIVINTYNRVTTLPATLNSLKYLRYPGEFEVIVVNGPSDDGTTELLANWPDPIRVGQCTQRNLSVSRNIGIAMAQGEIVAFIDDDAIPEADWLTHLAAAYEDEAVGAAGGRVYNPTGYEFQTQYLTVERLGNSTNTTIASPHLSYPYAWRFPQNMGTNASYRKKVLLEVGAFDEEFDYYLDETDVCARVVDAGYIVAQLENAYVHHKFAKSHLRDERKILRNHTSVFKNKIYFSLIYGRDYLTEQEIWDDNINFINRFRDTVKWAIGEGLVPEDELMRFEQQVDEAMKVGLERAHSNLPRKFISQETQQKYKGSFLPFPTVTTPRGKEIVFINQWYDHPGGISSHYRTLAKELALLGHIVHVICQHGESYNQVELEDGVWVHRMASKEHPLSDEARSRRIPAHIWSWSFTALEECRRIDSHRHIDVVEAAVWNAEGCAFLLEGRWPLVTLLVTPLAVWLETNLEEAKDKHWMEDFGYPMLALEKELMQKCDAVDADSLAIVSVIENAYDFTFDKSKLSVVYLGIPPVTFDVQKTNKTLSILFVGRLEKRKGVDVLLEVIPEILSDYPNVQLLLAGDDSIEVNGNTYKGQFQSKYKNEQNVLDRVHFLGRVDDDELKKLYETCDIFVAPSRFESFGLIFLEAMRVGKPVIGCDVGGMLEIIEPGKTGLFAKPGDSPSLSEALRKLLDDGDLRKCMGQAGYELFHEKFTSQVMAKNFVNLCEKHFSWSRD